MPGSPLDMKFRVILYFLLELEIRSKGQKKSCTGLCLCAFLGVLDMIACLPACSEPDGGQGEGGA